MRRILLRLAVLVTLCAACSPSPGSRQAAPPGVTPATGTASPAPSLRPGDAKACRLVHAYQAIDSEDTDYLIRADAWGAIGTMAAPVADDPELKSAMLALISHRLGSAKLSKEGDSQAVKDLHKRASASWIAEQLAIVEKVCGKPG